MKRSAQSNDPRWVAKREAIIERDGRRCTKCAAVKGPMTVHHLRYVRGLDLWDYPDEDLVTLCKKCHYFLHHDESGEWRYYRRLKRRPQPEPAEADASSEQLAAADRPSARSPVVQPGYRKGREPWNKGRRYPAERLTREEVQRLQALCSLRSFSGTRNRALVTLLYRSGLRLNEALDLYPKDLDAAGNSIRVLHGKGDKDRTASMDADGFAVIQRWLDRRAAAEIKPRSRLFCTRYSTPLSGSYVRQVFRRLGERAGIEKRVHPHALRHTYAAELAEEGKPINLIQAALGHANIATTSRYLAHIAPQQVIDMARSRGRGNGGSDEGLSGREGKPVGQGGDDRRVLRPGALAP